MRGLSSTARGAVTTDADMLRSELRDRSAVAVDARRPDEYRRGHIPSAVNLPLADLLKDDSPERVARLAGSIGIDDETRVVVYDDTFGALASRIAWTLEYIGHADVTLLGTTYSQWQSMGIETTADGGGSGGGAAATDVQPRQHGHTVNPDMLATHEYLERAMADDRNGSGDTILLDNRERLNFLEQHIPGAVSLPYRTLSGPDGSILRDRADMQRLFANRGITGGSEVITYCGSVGTLSGLAYYALRSAGLPNARLYVRSFREWKDLQKPTTKQEDANYWDLSAE